MAISVHSCLRPPPPPKLTTLHETSSSSTVAPGSERKEVSWRSRCVATAACVIIGSTVGLGGGDGNVLAGEVRAVEGSEVRMEMRWSDKRRCPPWHANSLENIVPENLPRPFGGRRSDGHVAYGHHMAAPVIGSFIHYRSSCFSL
ncbi:hypothetical protein C4D60_Mb06t03080 [Musa balbisiana]|uniref:Uncharacterized protein n=1 Tax=Musa balbisiana TaxID=52838 RepID=A0A4V4H3M6_MUSBA|nr:hypothetical protein C4D60_Mb06t03080 [Musa balbisiana]